jgi:hypothetical protein
MMYFPEARLSGRKVRSDKQTNVIRIARNVYTGVADDADDLAGIVSGVAASSGEKGSGQSDFNFSFGFSF